VDHCSCFHHDRLRNQHVALPPSAKYCHHFNCCTTAFISRWPSVGKIYASVEVQVSWSHHRTQSMPIQYKGTYFNHRSRSSILSDVDCGKCQLRWRSCLCDRYSPGAESILRSRLWCDICSPIGFVNTMSWIRVCRNNASILGLACSHDLAVNFNECDIIPYTFPRRRTRSARMEDLKISLFYVLFCRHVYLELGSWILIYRTK
jgi:hypothetical protein